MEEIWPLKPALNNWSKLAANPIKHTCQNATKQPCSLILVERGDSSGKLGRVDPIMLTVGNVHFVKRAVQEYTVVSVVCVTNLTSCRYMFSINKKV